mmetsp:Transcript_22432/g.68349  ORF Transcript_22432/g.68349 Transcript_22432/m.68349 type:complete len:220 (+) Transcript_22432:495-1154(+)
MTIIYMNDRLAHLMIQVLWQGCTRDKATKCAIVSVAPSSSWCAVYEPPPPHKHQRKGPDRASWIGNTRQSRPIVLSYIVCTDTKRSERAQKLENRHGKQPGGKHSCDTAEGTAVFIDIYADPVVINSASGRRSDSPRYNMRGTCVKRERDFLCISNGRYYGYQLECLPRGEQANNGPDKAVHDKQPRIDHQEEGRDATSRLLLKWQWIPTRAHDHAWAL